MKAYRNLAIICVFLLLLQIGAWIYVVKLDRDVNAQLSPIENSNPYIPYQKASLILVNTIVDQSTDERGLISVSFVRDGKYWFRDYISKTEYDSAFHNYVNYKP